MSDTQSEHGLPQGYSPPKSPKTVRPERLAQMTSLQFLTPDRLAVVQELSYRLARDPQLLDSVERMLRDNGVLLESVMPATAELTSFGWSESGLERMPTARQAAAAVGAAVAAVAGGPAAAIVVAV